MHYTAIHSMTMKEAEKFRAELLETVLRTRKIVEPAAAEEIFSITMDFNKIT